MEKQPLLSVIVPVYNTGDFLPRCMDSLKRQVYGNLEIILVDDGSKDESGALCDQYAAGEGNVTVLHKENQGLGYARNSGLDVARGEYVTFLDSDDYVDQDMYSSLISAMIAENAQAAFCDFCHVRSDGAKVVSASAINEGVYTGLELAACMLGAAPESKTDCDFDMSVCKGVYSRKIIGQYNIRFCSERKTICEDLIFNMEYLPKVANAVYVKKGFYYYCENAGSLTHRYIMDRLRKEKALYEQVITVTDEWLDKQRLRLDRLFLARIRMTIRQEVFRGKDIPLCSKLKEIERIAEDTTVRAVIESYPVRRNTLKLRVFHTFLKCKCILGMYILIKLNG